MVRAKFKVSSIKFQTGTRTVRDANGNPVKVNGSTQYEECKMASIEAFPVYANGDPNHENTKFWDASPGGKLELNCINPEAFTQFGLGQEFFLDFTPSGPAPKL